MMGMFLVKLFMWQYAIAAVAFAFNNDWGRVKYFIGAIILSWGVLTMK